MEMTLHSAKCTMWCAVSKQGHTGPICVEGTITKEQHLQELKVILVIQGARHADTTIFQQDANEYTANIVFNVWHDVFNSHVLSN